MKKVSHISLIILLFFFNINSANSNNNIAFIDLDIVLKKTIIGKSLLSNLDETNKKNIKELQNKEIELRNNEEELKKKQNIISQDQFEEEVENLKEKVEKFRILKNEMVNSLNIKKSEELTKFFEKINPIIQNYMDTNSIEILLERKNVFIGKNKSDITDIIVKEIDNKFKN